MTAQDPRLTLDPRRLQPGEPLTPMAIEVTATVIVAGAIATRDFMPVHHDREYAQAQGSPDIFMNILSDTGYCSRFLTDWAGPEAMVTRLAIRLGLPVFPGTTLTYTGEVTDVALHEGGARVDVSFRAVTEMGEHLSGSATLDLPIP